MQPWRISVGLTAALAGLAVPGELLVCGLIPGFSGSC